MDTRRRRRVASGVSCQVRVTSSYPSSMPQSSAIAPGPAAEMVIDEPLEGSGFDGVARLLHEPRRRHDRRWKVVVRDDHDTLASQTLQLGDLRRVEVGPVLEEDPAGLQMSDLVRAGERLVAHPGEDRPRLVRAR